MDWAWVAIGFGVLMIAFRAPLIFRPHETLEFYRAMVATDARVRAVGALYLTLGLAASRALRSR